MRNTFYTAPLSALPCTSIPDQNLFQLHLSLPDFYFIGESLFHQFGNSNECVNLFYTMKFLWEICCSFFFSAIFSFPNAILARHFSMTKAYFIIFFFCSRLAAAAVTSSQFYSHDLDGGELNNKKKKKEKRTEKIESRTGSHSTEGPESPNAWDSRAYGWRNRPGTIALPVP